VSLNPTGNGEGSSHNANKVEYTLMLSQQDMEDFMGIEAAPGERDEEVAKPGKPSSALQSGTKAGDEVRTAPDPRSLHRDYLQEGMRSLLSAGDQVSDLLARVAGRP
jgi:hypothetical protein